MNPLFLHALWHVGNWWPTMIIANETFVELVDNFLVDVEIKQGRISWDYEIFLMLLLYNWILQFNIFSTFWGGIGNLFRYGTGYFNTLTAT